MRIIIEGVDKSGKSTLIENMKNKFEYGITLKSLIKPKDASEEETQKIQRVHEEVKNISDTTQPNTFYVLDRFYQSEVVYSILRGNDRFLEPEFMSWVRDIEKEICHDTLLVLLETDPKIVAQRFRECKEDFAKENEIPLLQERYRKIFNLSILPKIKIDTLTLGIDKSIEIIKKELEKI